MARSLGHRPALDGVRAIAIVAVMGLHAIDRLFLGGFYGVDIFFVLSAFLITSLILGELNANAGAYRFRDFYWRRALRLGPALVLWLAFLAWPTAVVAGEGSHFPLWTAGSLLYVGNFLVFVGIPDGNAYTHVWSLAVEEQFYLVWPLALVLLWRRLGGVRAVRWSFAAVVLAFVIYLLTTSLVSGNYFLATGHLLPLALGVSAALLYAEGHNPQLERVVRLRSLALASLFVLGVIICGYQVVRPVGGVLLQTVVSVGTTILILYLCLVDGSAVHRVLTLPPVVWLGRRSYGLYLYHRTLTILLPELLPGLTLRYLGPLVLLVSFLLAEASFRFVERPVMRVGRSRLEQRRRRETADTDHARDGARDRSRA